MFDIHNHLIYEFDDGPKSLQEAVDMLKEAEAQGITHAFATSHFQEIIPITMEDDYFRKLEELRNRLEAENVQVQIHAGSELFYHHFMNETVKQHRVCRLNGTSKYVLFEFPLYLKPTGYEEAIFQLKMDGYFPILAHPERYTFIQQDPEKIVDILKLGALLQVNTGSILGNFGRTAQRLARQFLELRLVSFLGSDAHRKEGRSFSLKPAIDEIRHIVDNGYIEELTHLNPAKILTNTEVESPPIPEFKNGGLFSRLRKIFTF